MYCETCFRVSNIAVAHQTRTSDQTFEGVVDPNHPPFPAVQPSPYLVQFWLNFTAKFFWMPKSKIGTASEVQNSILKISSENIEKCESL